VVVEKQTASFNRPNNVAPREVPPPVPYPDVEDQALPPPVSLLKQIHTHNCRSKIQTKSCLFFRQGGVIFVIPENMLFVAFYSC
jgi:hypothetical protein